MGGRWVPSRRGEPGLGLLALGHHAVKERRQQRMASDDADVGMVRRHIESAAAFGRSTSKVSGLEQGFCFVSVLLYALGEGGLERRGNGSREGRRRCHDVCAYAGRAQPERRLGRGHPASKGQALCCPFPEQW